MKGADMITSDDLEKIQVLKAKGYSQNKIAKELTISRATVARNWGQKKLTIADLFSVGACSSCGTIHPRAKYQPTFQCPYCKKIFTWREPWYKPEEEQV
jgi:hypothetical protein